MTTETNHTIDIDTNANSLSDLVNRVAEEHVAFDLVKNGKSVAKLVPTPRTEGVTAAELEQLLKTLPKLGEDAEIFWQDVQALRSEYAPETDPWE